MNLCIWVQFEVIGQISVGETLACILARLCSEMDSGNGEGAVQNIAIFSRHEISSYEPIVKCIHIIH